MSNIQPNVLTDYAQDWKLDVAGRDLAKTLKKELDLDVDYIDNKLRKSINHTLSDPFVFDPSTWSTPNYNKNNITYNSDFLEEIIKQYSIPSSIFTTQYLQKPMSSIITQSGLSPEDLEVEDKTPVLAYPIQNRAWTQYKRNSTLTGIPSIVVGCRKAIEWIEKHEKEDTPPPIFITKSREARNIIGHLTDPWDRSLNTYRSRFVAKLLARQQTKVQPNYCEELLVWEAHTTCDGTPVALLIWEEVKMSYVRKSAIENFLMYLNPMEIKMTDVYEV